MSLCINPNCSHTQNPDSHCYCQGCGSELLLSGRYRVGQLLSDKGGFGKTYEVTDGSNNKVLKVLINNHPHAVKLFQQEAEVLSRLKHPGIPQGEGYFTYFPRDSKNPVHCLLMEKIEGVDLEEYQKQHQYKPISQDLALDWLIQLSTILHEVHTRKFFHRDIKPSNIILKPDGQLVLIDFGAVRQVTQTILAGGQNTRLYTSGYAPPEQERGYAVQQSDFYALARTFVYLLTGKEPNDASIYDYQNNELKWQKLCHDIDPKITNLIDTMMAEKVSRRPENTTLILHQLKEIKEELYPQQTLVCIPQNPAIATTPSSSPLAPASPYAGFWLRFKASAIDNTIVSILAAIADRFLIVELSKLDFFNPLYVDLVKNNNFLLYCLSLSILGTTVLGYLAPLLIFYYFYTWPSHTGNFMWAAFMLSFLLGFLLKWGYYVVLESSWFKGTLGKILVGIMVIDKNGKRISLKQANRRYWSKIISTLTCYIGFMLAGWTKRKRSLHDMISGTIVTKRKS